MPLELDGRVFISSAKTATQLNVHHLQVSKSFKILIK